MAEYEPDEALVDVAARAIHEAGPCDDTDCTDPDDRGYCDKRAEAVLKAVGPTLLARGYEQGADDEAQAWYRNYDDYSDVEHAKNPYLGGTS